MRRLDAYARHHGLYATALVGAAALMLYQGRVLATGSPTFWFLPYNLALGVIPLAAALAADGLARTRLRPAVGPLLALWLAFFPNSVYLLTDLVHLRPRPPMNHVYDGTLLGVFAAAGFLAGLASMSLVEDLVRRGVGRAASALSIAAVCGLTGLGVYMGRYLRFNSWDLVHDPLGVLRVVVGLMVQPSLRLWGTTLTYALVVGVAWLAFLSMRPTPISRSAAGSAPAPR